MKNYNLENNESFCMFPFLGYRNLHGYYSPCPIYWRNSNFFSSNNKLDGDNIEKNLNSNELKQLRKDMLENNKDSSIINDVCRICKEHNSKGMSCLRNAGNKFLSEFYDEIIKNLNDDYSLKDTNVLFSSFTNNNICNFKCRMCDKERSSSFLTKKDKKLNEFLNPNILIRKKIYDDNYNILKNSKFIYFGYSGEPFITPDHTYILEKLIKDKQIDKTIIYHTNCSYVDSKILSIMSQFKKIIILASLDGMKEHHKIIRPSNISWFTIEKNIENFISLDNLEFNVYASVGALNAYHIIDLYNYFVKRKFIKQNNFIINPVYNFLTAGNLSTLIKEDLKKEYTNFIENINLNDADKNFHNNTIKDEFSKFNHFLDVQKENEFNLFINELRDIYSSNRKYFIKHLNYLVEYLK